MLKIQKQYENLQVGLFIPLHVYPATVMFAINMEEQQLEKEIKKSLIPDDFKSNKHKWVPCEARYAWYPRSGFGLIMLKKFPETASELSYMAHEIAHIVYAVMEHVGMRLDCGVSCEAYTYLTSFITEEVLKKMTKYYKPVK